MSPWLILFIYSLVPVAATLVLYNIRLKDVSLYQNKRRWQIVVGIIFGIIAILGTEFGVPINGATMNARDAAPLCAGLFFGPLAGIIAGAIGGVERWFAVLWGAGTYTRLACSISTVIAGLYGAFIRKYICKDYLPSWYYAFATGLVTEVFHMSMVFLTNMSDPQMALSVVRTCTFPMVSVNAFAVLFASLGISALRKQKGKTKGIHITQQVQFYLLLTVVLCFFLTTLFTTQMQSRITDNTTDELLSLNIADVRKSVRAASDNNLFRIGRSIASDIEENGYEQDYLEQLLKKYDIDEINVVDEKGIIIATTYPDFLNFNMGSGAQSSEFLCLLKEINEYAQPYQATTFDSSLYRKYAGISVDSGGFIQVGYESDSFQDDMISELTSIIRNRHIGESGYVFIVSLDGQIYGAENVDEDVIEQFREQNGVVLNKVIDGEESYCMSDETEGFLIVAVYPTSEADFNANLSAYLNTFLEIMIFAALFVMIYILMDRLIVNNIAKVNDSLAKITEGDFDEIVDVKINREFENLSDGINSTVSSIRGLLKETEERMNTELQYARDIQQSVLPGVFPPFPDQDGFDIYAMMHPAKEVGGDFYDFYMLGDGKLAIVVADVSGKGVPAALFMMRAKTVIKSYAEAGLEVNDILSSTNEDLCDGNTTGMFVTCWMGIVDFKTHTIKYANAGHNPPAVRRKDGTFEFLRSRPGLVLAGMSGINYRINETTLDAGEEIFLYTDGVTEATDKDKELFGEDRLLEALNRAISYESMDLCLTVEESIGAFVRGELQFDDITMLSLKLLK